MLDEYGFRHHGTHAAGTGQSGDRRQHMQKKNGEIAHRAILPRSRARTRNAHEFWNSPWTGSLDVPDDQADGNRRLRLSFVGAHKCQAWQRYASSEQLR